MTYPGRAARNAVVAAAITLVLAVSAPAQTPVTPAVPEISTVAGIFITEGYSLYTLTPCRALDTRSGSGAFSGELTVNVAGSTCGPSSADKAYVFNATVIPKAALGFLTLWPDSEAQPGVSTLNAQDGATTSNMAIVPNENGSTDAYASGDTQLLLDISAYFAP
jgi:hypothetical protein